MHIHFGTLENTEESVIFQCFMEAFSNYFVSMKGLQEAVMLNRWRAAGVQWEVSAGAWASEKLSGFIVSALGEWEGQKTAYNSGTGVIASLRGRKVSVQMYEHLFPKFIEIGIERCMLEVITQNTPAIKAYRAVGLEIDRELICFYGEASPPKPKGSYEIRDISILDWDAWQKDWDILPSWEAMPVCLKRNAVNLSLQGIYVKDELAGYAACLPGGHIAQFVIAPAWRRQGLGTALFHHLHHKYSKLKINNVDSRAENLISFFQKMNLPIIIKQYEMSRLIC